MTEPVEPASQAPAATGNVAQPRLAAPESTASATAPLAVLARRAEPDRYQVPVNDPSEAREAGSAPQRSARAERHPLAIAALFVIPYVLLMLTWAFANPPGAAPDEPDHLIKAIGVGRLHIGEPLNGTISPSAGLITQRNASITREVTVPEELAPDGFKCTAHKSTTTAACLPTTVTQSKAMVTRPTPVGAYPPFLYLPIGLAVRAATSPTSAFLIGRVVCLILSCGLLFLGAAQLARWLGRRALLGGFLCMTPMVVFCGSIVSTSGFEITSSFALACVVVAAIRRPESLQEPLTHITLAVAGTALILSRELGLVTFAALVLLLVARVGPGSLMRELARRQASLLGSIAVLVVAMVAELWWEHTYDHPSITASAFDSGAVGAFSGRTSGLLAESIGNFGWLDTLVPPWVYNAWIILALIVIGLAVTLGSGADRWTLVGWLVAVTVLAYVVYATVFYPIRAGLQGRHLLPFFMLCPILAGSAAVDALDRVAPAAVRRLFGLSAFVLPVIQIVCLYINSRRYAVGSDGPVFFWHAAQWSPSLGWTTWLLAGLIGSIALSCVITSFGFAGGRSTRKVHS